MDWNSRECLKNLIKILDENEEEENLYLVLKNSLDFHVISVREESLFDWFASSSISLHHENQATEISPMQQEGFAVELDAHGFIHSIWARDRMHPHKEEGEFYCRAHSRRKETISGETHKVEYVLEYETGVCVSFSAARWRKAKSADCERFLATDGTLQ